MGTKPSRPDASALIHGAAWRAASLASRVAFLALVVPRTIPGEYGVFFSYSSIGLLLSRIVSVGAIDHLPTKVKGQPDAMRRAARDLVPFVAVATAVTSVAAVIDALSVAALALALCMASGLMLAGAIRSVSPAWFERWLNLHPVLLLGMALLLGLGVSARQLLVCQSVAILASQLILLRVALARADMPHALDPRPWHRRVAALLAGGQTRMLSDALIAGCIRGVAIGPVLFGVGAISDSLALALALGEAVWTVGMILVHRNFAFYCSTGPDSAHSVRSAAVLLVGILAAGVVGAGLVWVAQSLPVAMRFDSLTLLAAFAFFAGITALSELRYYDLAAGSKLSPWVLAQVIFLVLAAISPDFLGESWSVWVLAGVTTVASVSLIARRSLSPWRDSGTSAR